MFCSHTAMRAFIFVLFVSFRAWSYAQPMPSFQMLPNPAQNRASIHLENIDIQHMNVRIFTIFGTPVTGIYQQILKGENKINLYFPDVPEGIYLVRIQSKEFDQTQRLKIQR